MARHEQMALMHPSINYPAAFQSLADDFFGAYALERFIECPDEKMTNLTPPKQRICRFCLKKWPEVTFRKDAHLLSEFLGNKYLVYDSECDTCNQKFGTYEDHLAKYLGVARTMLSVKGKEKVPKVKSPGDKIVFESSLNDEGRPVVKVKRSEVLDQTIQIDRETLTQTTEFTKHPYVPLKVYKALLKMALASIAEKDIPYYRLAFDSLTSDKHDNALKPWSHVSRWTMPYTYCFTRPIGTLYRKRNSSNQMYTQLFVLTTLNYIYEFPVPFYAPDMQFSGDVLVPTVPPLFSLEYPFPADTISYSFLDLSSTEAVRNEKEIISFPLPKEIFEDRKIVDPETGEVRFEPFDPSKIIGFELTRMKPNPPHIGPSLITTTG